MGGAFVATINVFREMGVEIQEIYEMCAEIQTCYVPLKKICVLMNLQTDLLERWRVNNLHRVGGIQQRENLKTHVDKNKVTSPFVDDQIQMSMSDVSFAHLGGDPSAD